MVAVNERTIQIWMDLREHFGRGPRRYCGGSRPYCSAASGGKSVSGTRAFTDTSCTSTTISQWLDNRHEDYHCALLRRVDQ